MKAGLDTPVGHLSVTEAGGAIVRLAWDDSGGAPETPLLRQAIAELAAYFQHRLTEFTVPLDPPGSDFQRRVCAAMTAIPHGETRTYGDLARDLGVPPQPVGQACGANPIPVIIPCHRVLGAHGLGGYSGAGGVETKIALLRHEGAAALLI